jgi:hypothetical protein
MDIFGAPYAYYHSYDEVRGWYQDAGFGEIWYCNEGRRGFGVCGRGINDQFAPVSEAIQQQSSQVVAQTAKVQMMDGESA